MDRIIKPLKPHETGQRAGYIPNSGANNSDYFQLRQLKSLPPHPVKTTFANKKLASPTVVTINGIVSSNILYPN